MIQVIEESPMTQEVNKTPSKKSGGKKRFDSVRNLLEKVRHKLMTTRQNWSRSLSRSRAPSQDRQKQKESLQVPEIEISQSSPNTPAQLRKEKRHR